MPTISTRKFLKLLHSAFPALPMWGLFDADPAGVGIYSEYKHGSARSVSEGLALPNLQWLSDAQASRPAERLQQSGDSSMHAAAAAAPSIKHEPIAHSGHGSSLFGELQPDDEPAGLHQPGHAAAASASISLSEPMDDDGDSDVFAAFLEATSTEEVDEANQWFA